MTFYNINSLSLNDMSALYDGDKDKWIEKLEEKKEDMEVFLKTEVRWTTQKRAKMWRTLRVCEKALKTFREDDQKNTQTI